MKVTEAKISGVKIIEMPAFKDERGFFMETYNSEKFKQNGINDQFVQDNLSVSKKNVIRGLHGQMNPNQSKLVRCIKGNVFDVVFDIRPNSPTYLKQESFELTEENKIAVFIPHGCLHGFCAFDCEEAIFSYKTTGIYSSLGEFFVNPLDKDVNIKWPVDSDYIISEKDLQSKSLKELLESERYLKEICNSFYLS